MCVTSIKITVVEILKDIAANVELLTLQRNYISLRARECPHDREIMGYVHKNDGFI